MSNLSFHEEGLVHEVEIPKEKDYHGHPNYLKIYISLLILFSFSILASFLTNFILMVFIVFTIPAIKGLLVLNYFMHLRWEPKIFQILIYMCLFALAALLIGVYYDVAVINVDVFQV